MTDLEGLAPARPPQKWLEIVGPAGSPIWVRELAQPSSRGTVVMLPSLGRSAEDFECLAQAVWAEGYNVILPQPRGFGPAGATAPAISGMADALTLNDLADDVAAVIEAIGRLPVILIGHAFGNRVARMTASRRPALVSRLILLACGGHTPISSQIFEAMIGSMNKALTRETRLGHLRTAFFAAGNDPSVWLDGWNAEIAGKQAAAVRATPRGDWELGGGKPMTILQAEFDAIAPEANALGLKAQLGDRVVIVPINQAGHAMLPEQPDQVARAVIAALNA